MQQIVQIFKSEVFWINIKKYLIPAESAAHASLIYVFPNMFQIKEHYQRAHIDINKVKEVIKEVIKFAIKSIIVKKKEDEKFIALKN